MLVFVVAALTCWLCALLARPRRPLPHSPLDELLCDRLRANQRRAVVLACSVSCVALLAWILARPAAIDADAAVLRDARVSTGSAPIPDTRDTRGCFATWLVTPVCWREQPDGSWLVEGQLDDGTWVNGAPREDGTWSLVGLVVTPGVYPSAREWDGGGR